MKVILRNIAYSIGYDLVGFTDTAIPVKMQSSFEEFVRRGCHGEMNWFEKHLQIRKNPSSILPDARSAIVLGVLYRDLEYEKEIRAGKIKISRYAIGRDYHKVLGKKGKKFRKEIEKLIPGVKIRITVDSAPVPEKVLGEMAGLGWQGKNTNLINPQMGSFFFISVVFLDKYIVPDKPLKKRCGHCTLCIDACPTKALQPYRIDARRCLSYLTIELKSYIPDPFRKSTMGWAFGCDICQEVCPFNTPVSHLNRFSRTNDFRLRKEIKNLIHDDVFNPQDWENISSGSALGRINNTKFFDNVVATKER